MKSDPSALSFWQRHRTLILVASVVLFLPPLAAIFQLTADTDFCGSWCPRMFFPWRRGISLGAYFAGWLRSFAGVGLVAAVLLATWKLGRVWCSHLCPVGGAMELSSRLVPRRFKLPFKVVPAVPFRYGYLLVYLALPAIGLGSLCCSYCNFASVPRLFGAAFSPADLSYFLRAQGLINLGLLLVLGVFARGGRAYCNLLCPIGAFDALVNRFAARRGKRVRVDQERCTSCGQCARVCPTWAIPDRGKAAIDQLSCLPCRLCEKACPTGAIAYGRANT
jgi:ferredoxin-type protein NapH